MKRCDISLQEMNWNLFLVRHAVTDWNERGLLQGQKDIPLNKNGEKQAENIGRWFVRQSFPVDVIISSDLRRAVSTADAIAQAVGVRLRVDSRLRERGLGLAEGKTWDDVVRQHFSDNQKFPRPSLDDIPGVEPRALVVKRVNEVLMDVAGSVPPGSNIIVVSHGSALGSWLQWRLQLKQRPRLKNGEMVVLNGFPEQERIEVIDATQAED